MIRTAEQLSPQANADDERIPPGTGETLIRR